MPRIVRTYPARDDLRRIWLYIAERNLTAADRWIDKFERTLRSLARHPLMGESAGQFRPGLRRFTVGSYVLYYDRSTVACDWCAFCMAHKTPTNASNETTSQHSA